MNSLIADKQPFKGVENYFMDTLLCKDAHEALDGLAEERYDSGNEAYSEHKSLCEEDEDYEVNPSIVFNKINVIDATNDADE